MLQRPSPALVVSMLALIVSLGGAGIAASGGNFLLGVVNTASTETRLSAPFDGRTLQLVNASTTSAATALALLVATGRPPMLVNSSVKVDRLNVDYLDNLDSSAFAKATSEGWNYVGDSGKPGFQNGWGNFNGPTLPHNHVTYQHAAYRVDSLGVVHLGGLVAGGTVGQTILLYPARTAPISRRSSLERRSTTSSRALQ